LIVGVLIGTYSSIYVASPILLARQVHGKKK
jgi:preprotein translocase subunit SecF